MKKQNEDIDYNLEFEAIWSSYPNKQGKLKAKQSYIKARKDGTTYEEVYMGLERYIRYCRREQWYKPKHGSTWFNQQCWADEIDEGDNIEVTKDNFGNYVIWGKPW